MKRVLFLCTHNSARSQMAKRLLRHFGGDNYQVYSAGTEKTPSRPEAVLVLSEIGIDISQQQSKTLEQYLNEQFDEVITVCDDASDSCPVFPNAKNSGIAEQRWPTHYSGATPNRLLYPRVC